MTCKRHGEYSPCPQIFSFSIEKYCLANSIFSFLFGTQFSPAKLFSPKVVRAKITIQSKCEAFQTVSFIYLLCPVFVIAISIAQVYLVIYFFYSTYTMGNTVSSVISTATTASTTVASTASSEVSHRVVDNVCSFHFLVSQHFIHYHHFYPSKSVINALLSGSFNYNRQEGT